MKKMLQLSVVCLAGLLLAGCLVRSVEPWLPNTTWVASPALAGSWQDVTQKVTAVFSLVEGSNYQVLVVSEDNKTSSFTATLNKVDDVLLLVVGPAKQEGLRAGVLIPAYLLFKVELADDTMKLYPLDLNSIEARLRSSQVGALFTGNKEKGYVLFATTPELMTFVRSQLMVPEFFNLKPLYQFKRAPAVVK